MQPRFIRAIYAGLGAIFFGIGFIGVFLPVLPTTPFMLLALWAFSRSSERLHDYLWNHPKFGPPIQSWKKYGALPLKVKVSALVVMFVSAVFMVFLSGAPFVGIVSALALMAIGALFILTRPTLNKEKFDAPIDPDAPIDGD